MPLPKAGKTLPKTKVHWDLTTLSDCDPVTKLWTTFWFPRRMIAWPLTLEGPGGFGPDNKAAWWPYFQARHTIGALYWVQGHMLNDNVHGPGTPMNLVPISNALNTNMLGCVERLVKAVVATGEVVYYEVEAHWEGATELGAFQLAQDAGLMTGVMSEQMSNIPAAWKAQKDEEAIKFPGRKKSKFGFENPFAGGTFRPTREMLHPMAMRQTCGLISQGGSLLWGEQFAPTRLSWKIGVSGSWSTAPDWNLSNHTMTAFAQSPRSDEWNNNFP